MINQGLHHDQPGLRHRHHRLKIKVSHERRRELDVGRALERGAVQEMKVWPFGVALRGRLQTTTCCGSGDVTVVSDVEKAPSEASGGDQEDERERITDDVSLFNSSGIRTGVPC
jgi:hypothetical protein